MKDVHSECNNQIDLDTFALLFPAEFSTKSLKPKPENPSPKQGVHPLLHYIQS